MIKLYAIHNQTGESQEKNLTPEALMEGEGLIGRHPGCDLVLNSPEVSRVHGRIVYRKEQYYFSDLGSTSGSQINDEEAPTNQSFLLNPNDIIRIGEFTLLVKEVEVNGNSTISQPQKTPVLEVEAIRIEQLIFKAEELEDRGIVNQRTAEFIFQGKLLVKNLSFSKRFRQKAIDICQAELDVGNFCLLVEHADHITIWQEKQAGKQKNNTQFIPTS